MKTEIFENYGEFKKREYKSTNGVSRKVFDNIYAWETSEQVGLINMRDDNQSNVGCWDCVDCTECISCTNLDNCHDCQDCHSCNDIKNEQNVEFFLGKND